MLSEIKIDKNTSTERKNEMFVLISLLHINGFINNHSLHANFKNLRNGKILRCVNSYHSKINDRWYNYDNIVEIYEDILDDMISLKNPKARLNFERNNKLRYLNGLEPKKFKTELTFEETLKYLNFYLNKNRNYCIDHLFHEFIKPNILRFEYNKTISRMFNYNFDYIESRERKNNDWEYCCEYCCGPYEYWLTRRFEINYHNVHIEICKIVSEFLNTKREKYKNSYKKFEL